jgi:hypothetical protein
MKDKELKLEEMQASDGVMSSPVRFNENKKKLRE